MRLLIHAVHPEVRITAPHCSEILRLRPLALVIRRKLGTIRSQDLQRVMSVGIALTEAGEIVLRYARRMLSLNDELLDTIRGASLAGTLRLGFSQDFADTILPIVLAQFTSLYPLVQMEVRIEGNALLVEAVENGQLDLALAVGQQDRPTAQTIGTLDLVWIAGQDFTVRDDQPLPLVLLGPQCAFRKEAISRLDQANQPWRVAAVSPSTAGLWASAIGGLGITLRSSLGLPARLVWGKELFGLPSSGLFPVTLHLRSEAVSPPVERLRAIISEVVLQQLPRLNRRKFSVRQTT
jgi:DNA-binding transcriptional LysR family regulator